MSSSFLILFLIGFIGLQIGEVRGSERRGLSLLFSKLLSPTDEEISDYHKFKPLSEEDILFIKGLYNAIVTMDGTDLNEIVHQAAEKPEKRFSSILSKIISKILGNDKEDEEIKERHEFKYPLTRDVLEQLTELYKFVSDGVIVPDRLDLWELPYGIVKPDSPEGSSASESPKFLSPFDTPTLLSPSDSPKESSPHGSPKGSSPSRSPKESSPSRSPKESSPHGSPKGSSPSRSTKGSSPSRSPEGSSPPRSLKGSSPSRSLKGSSPSRSPEGSAVLA